MNCRYCHDGDDMDALRTENDRLMAIQANDANGYALVKEQLSNALLQVSEMESWKADLIGRLEHYTGDLWPSEVQQAAKSLLQDFAKKPFNEKELKERLALIENGKCPECGQKVHLHNCTEKRKCECSCHPPNSQVQQCGACSGNHV